MTKSTKWPLFLVGALAFSLILGCGSGSLKREQADLHLQIGTGHLLKGHYPQALAELQEAERLDPDSALIQNNLGLAYFMGKHLELAQQHLYKALVLNPKYSDARNNYGRLFIELTRYDDAITELTQVTKDLTYSNPEKAFVNLGLAYLKKGEIKTALNNFKKSLEANNRFCPGHNYYGQALFQLQKYHEAIESFETALRLCNNHYDEAHYFSALSYFKIGQREKAIARLQEVSKLYPESEYAPKAQAMLKILK